MGVVSMGDEAADACLRLHRTSTSEAVTEGARDLDNVQCKDESSIHPAIATAIAIVLSSGVASILTDADPCSGVVRSGSERRFSPPLVNQTLRQDRAGRGPASGTIDQQGHRSSAWR